MHPPPFRRDHKMSDWPDCWLELHCPKCGGAITFCLIRTLLERHRDRTFARLLAKLRCRKCGGRPAPVYLCASPHRRGRHGGPEPDWAIELVPVDDGVAPSHIGRPYQVQ